MADQRQHSRYQVEFPATFTDDNAGTGIVYNLGMGGCKVVSDLEVKSGARPRYIFRFLNRRLLSLFEPPQSGGPWRWSLGWTFGGCRKWSVPVWSNSWQLKPPLA